MPSQHLYFLHNNPLRCKGIRSQLRILPFVQLLLIVVSAKISTTTDGMYATANSGYGKRTNRRWRFGRDRFRNDRDDSAYSSSWREIVEGKNHHNPHDDLKGSIIKKYSLKNRLGLFHFGKITQLSLFEGNNNDELNGKSDNIKEHPLRTNLWEMDLKWSFLSRNSKILYRTNKWKIQQGEKIVQLDLDPEGYCRIVEKSSTSRNKYQDRSNSPVLAIGRWKKRPWGVTIVVRPLFILKSSKDVTNFDYKDNEDKRYYDDKTLSKKNKKFNIIDEQTEFIFHANNFHWNGFGSNPKLTQGTILFQKQKNKKNMCWWKSSTLSYSSILPVWPEELSGENYHDEVDGIDSDSFGIVFSDLLRFWGIFNVKNNNRNSMGTRQRWFRPVVGTFTAKGIVRK